MNRTAMLILALLVVPLGFADRSLAGIISINQADLTSSSQIDNSGAYVSGSNLFGTNTAATANVTINGVQFKSTKGGYYFEGPSTTPGTFRYVGGSASDPAHSIFPNGSLDSNLTTLLSTTLFGASVADVAVVDLDSTKTYRLQFISGDNRGVVGSHEGQDYLIRSGTFTPGSPSPAQGTYTAGSTIGSFDIDIVNQTTSAAKIVTIVFTGYAAIDIKANGLPSGYSGTSQAYMSGLALYTIPTPAALPMGLSLLTLIGLKRDRRAIHRRRA